MFSNPRDTFELGQIARHSKQISDVIKELEKSTSHLKELEERALAPYRALAEVDKALRTVVVKSFQTPG